MPFLFGEFQVQDALAILKGNDLEKEHVEPLKSEEFLVVEALPCDGVRRPG